MARGRGPGDDVGRGCGGVEVGRGKVERGELGSQRARSRTHGMDSDEVGHGLTAEVSGF